MGVILHPIMFFDEVFEFPDEPWLDPFILGEKSQDCKVLMPGTYKRNEWIRLHPITDEDYYITADDDDMYEPGVFDEIRKTDDDIVIISMKRGHHTPKGVVSPRDYPTDTLFAHPDNVQLGCISAQQSFVKGKIFKTHPHNEEFHCWDGELAVHHKESGEQIAYRPDLFALFNYFEPGRWETREKVFMGAMVNDAMRLNMVLQQSQLSNEKLHYVTNPESATRGLNYLLDKADRESADIAVLVHQDVYFRHGWLELVRAQIKLLPENWLSCGVIGKDMTGRICGKFWDHRIPLTFDTSNIHTFPHPACCFDEAVIIINLKHGFRFDESYEGFDLYGTMIVLEGWDRGLSSWVIECMTDHYCMRSFDWHPSDTFCKNYKRMYDKFQGIRVDSTALGLPPDGEVRFETSAAPEEAA